MISFSKENFLKQLWSDQENGNAFTAFSFLAEELKVSNAAITDMARKLAVQGFVNHIPYKGMTLTQKGKTEALKVVRRHRLWELFLIRTLGMNWADVHEEAEKLEHHSSEKLIDRIEEFMDFPRFDPHGAPIPDRFGNIPNVPELTLFSDAIVGEDYLVARVYDQDTVLIKYLSRIGLFLNTKIKIHDKIDFDNSTWIINSGNEFLISEKVGQNILLQSLNNIQ